jgi:hypothetical protein
MMYCISVFELNVMLHFFVNASTRIADCISAPSKPDVKFGELGGGGWPVDVSLNPSAYKRLANIIQGCLSRASNRPKIGETVSALKTVFE